MPTLIQVLWPIQRMQQVHPNEKTITSPGVIVVVSYEHKEHPQEHLNNE
jgi:hypothetical protein